MALVIPFLEVFVTFATLVVVVAVFYFRKKKDPPVDIVSTFGNLLQLRNKPQEALAKWADLLERHQEHLAIQIEALVAKARKHGTKNRRAALLALRRKKRLIEIEISRIDGTLMTLELQREALESAKNNLQVLGAMKDAANVLKNAQKHVTADKFLDIMDDINEQLEIAGGTADAMSDQMAMGYVDESELENELEALEQENLSKGTKRGVDADEKKQQEQLDQWSM